MVQGIKTSLTPEEQRKTIFVNFLGGFRDGLTLRSDSEHPGEAQECMGFYILHSQGGKVGKRIRSYLDAGVAELQELVVNTPEGPRLKREPVMEMSHIYEVTDRQEDDLTIRVRYQYMGQQQ